MSAPGPVREPEYKVTLLLSPREREVLERLSSLGLYGDSPSFVVAYLIQRGLDDLLRAGVIR